MTTKRVKLKPVKMWAVFDEGGYPFEATQFRDRVELWRDSGERVARVLVTPIEPKKRVKK